MSLCFNYDVVLKFIPKGLTCILQPLDTSINKPFKNRLHKLYDQYCIDNSLNDSSKVTREKIIDFIESVWYDDEIIKKKSIIKSFKITGISNNPDSSEDKFYEVFKWIDERVVEKKIKLLKKLI